MTSESNESPKHVCLLNDNTIEIAHNKDNAKILAAQFLHALLFHESISLVDHLVVNNPAFRKALQTYPILLNVLDYNNTRILMRKGFESLRDLRDDHYESGRFHPSHTKDIFLNNDDIKQLDKKLRFDPFDLKEVARTFDRRVFNEGFESEFAREHLPEDVRLQVINYLAEIRKNKESGLLDQSDFERASRPVAPLEEKMGILWKCYEPIIFQIERAYYSTAIGSTLKQPLIFSPDHAQITDVLGKAVASDKIGGTKPLELNSSYFTIENLIHLPPEFYMDIRKGKDFGEWVNAINSAAKSTPGDNKVIKELNRVLYNYLSYINEKIKYTLGINAEINLKSKLEIGVFEGNRIMLTGLNTLLDKTIEPLKTFSYIPGLIVHIASNYPEKNDIGTLQMYIVQQIKELIMHMDEYNRYLSSKVGVLPIFSKNAETVSGQKNASYHKKEWHDTHLNRA